MKLLLDESLPRGLKNLLGPHEVTTVQEQGWAGTTNGEFLKLAEVAFEAFITADQNLEYQQNLQGYELRVRILAARTTRISDLEPLIPEVLEAVAAMATGETRRIAL